MSLYADIKNAVKTTWTAGWPHGGTYLVLWHENLSPIVPDVGSVSHWLHLSVSMGVDTIRAFGAGRRANERLHIGNVDIRVFTAVGIGEDTALDLLSDAVNVFRSARVGALSFIGDIASPDEGGTEDGAWWMRSALVAFEYRFTG